MASLTEPNNGDGREIKLRNNLIERIIGSDYHNESLVKKRNHLQPSFSVFMLCSEIPNLERAEHAMIERLDMIEFIFTFVDKWSWKTHSKKHDIR